MTRARLDLTSTLDRRTDPPHRVPRRAAPDARARRGAVRHRRQGRRRRRTPPRRSAARWPAGSPSWPTTRPPRCSSAGSTSTTTSTPARYHIGRRHVTDDAGEPMVLDWRAPLSRAFYRASARDPQGVAVRRRFGFVRRRADQLRGRAPRPRARSSAPPAAILTAEIERPRVGPMRDIVATIQPEQDELVRADLDDSICVQGAPGTGKTAVGLHRAAYLLYLHRERLRRSGVLIVGPNRAFLSLHLGGAAGARRGRGAAGHGGRPDRPGAGARRPTPPRRPRSSTTRGWPTVLRRGAVGPASAKPTEPIMVSGRLVPLADRRGAAAPDRRRGAARGAAVRDRPRAGPGPGGRRCCSGSRRHRTRRLAGRGLAAPDGHGRAGDRVPGRGLAGGHRRRRWWSTVLRRDPLAAADGMLTADEQAALRWTKPPRTAKAARWSAADAVLIDEAAGLIERPTSFGHVVRRRGAGPLPDAVPGDRPAQRARLDHAARRPGPGHRAVGRHRLAGHARATSASRTRRWCR